MRILDLGRSGSSALPQRFSGWVRFQIRKNANVVFCWVFFFSALQVQFLICLFSGTFPTLAQELVSV